MNRYGLIFDVPSPDHYVLGSSPLPFTVLQPDGDWQNYLPVREFQSRDGIETYACVVYTLLNCLEILIKRKYGEERNYSERFLATVAETGKNQGSSPQVVCEFLRKLGCPPEKVYPFDEAIKTTDEYFQELYPALYTLALEFTNEWDFGHEFVPIDAESITKALQTSPLMISVYAWVLNDRGLYYRPDGVGDIHATTLVYERIGAFRRVFDTYDNPYIKDYDWNSMPTIVKRFTIERKKKLLVKPSMWQLIVSWFRALFAKPKHA